MEKIEILNIIEKYSKKELNDFFKYSYFLRESFASGTRLKGSYNFALDNNIFIRIEEWTKTIITPRVLAVLTFFNWFKSQQYFKGRIVVFPSIFYEFSRKADFSNLNDYWDKFLEIRNLFEDNINLELFFESGVANFDSAKDIVSRIRFDESILIEEYRRIKNYKYSIGELIDWLSNDGIDKQSYSKLSSDYISRYYLHDIETKYFSKEVFYKLFIECILRELVKRKDFERTFNLKIYKEHLKPIVEFKTNMVKGIGDLEIFLKCNLIVQNDLQRNGQNYYPYIPLTLDNNLFEILQQNSVMINGWTFEKGKDDSVFNSIFQQDYVDQKRRMTFAEKNMNDFYNLYEPYFEDYINIAKKNVG